MDKQLDEPVWFSEVLTLNESMCLWQRSVSFFVTITLSWGRNRLNDVTHNVGDEVVSLHMFFGEKNPLRATDLPFMEHSWDCLSSPVCAWVLVNGLVVANFCQALLHTTRGSGLLVLLLTHKPQGRQWTQAVKGNFALLLKAALGKDKTEVIMNTYTVLKKDSWRYNLLSSFPRCLN